MDSSKPQGCRLLVNSMHHQNVHKTMKQLQVVLSTRTGPRTSLLRYKDTNDLGASILDRQKPKDKHPNKPKPKSAQG